MKIARLGLVALLCACVLTGCGSSEPEEVQDQDFKLKLSSKTLEGSYTGTMVGKEPEGNGTFVAESEGHTVKYVGEWADGVMNGEGFWYTDDKAIFDGTFNEGKVETITRTKSGIDDDDLTQIHHVANYCLKLPEGWTYIEADEQELLGSLKASEIQVTNPADECMRIYIKDFSTANAIGAPIGTYNDYIKKQYEITQSNGSVETDDEFEEKTDDHAYAHKTYKNDEVIVDVYELITQPAYFDVGIILIEENGTTDYSDAALAISRNLTTWKVYENALVEQQKAEKNEEIQNLLTSGENGSADWDAIESKFRKITGRDIVDNKYPYETVLVEGVVSNLNGTAFHFWTACDGTFYRNDNINCSTLPEGVTNGMTIELLIDTNDVGYLWSSARAARILDVPVYEDIIQEYKNTCPEMDYEAIMRNPTNARGTLCKVTGTVRQVVEVTDYKQDMLVSNSNGDYVYVTFSRNKNSDQLLEGDEISAYGIFYMTQSYTTVLGSSKTVPKLVSEYITIWK